MLEAVEKAGIFNGYLEDLVYTPKFIKAIESVKQGAIGRVLWAKSRETHPGPHSDWFWDIEQAVAVVSSILVVIAWKLHAVI
jgi:predicted dehydrogenase